MRTNRFVFVCESESLWESVCESFFVWVCVSPSLWESVWVCVSPSLCESVCESMWVLCVNLWEFVFVWVCASLCESVSLWESVCESFFVWVYVSPSLCESVCECVRESVRVCICVCLCVSLCVSLWEFVFVWVCEYLCMCVFLLQTPSVSSYQPPVHHRHGVEELHVWTLQADEEELCWCVHTEVAPPICLDLLHDTEASLNSSCGQRHDEDVLHDEEEVGELLELVIIHKKVLPGILLKALWHWLDDNPSTGPFCTALLFQPFQHFVMQHSFCNMTVILNTHLRPLLDFWRRTGWKWFSGQVCLLIWTQLNTYGEFWRDKLSITLHPASSL